MRLKHWRDAPFGRWRHNLLFYLCAFVLVVSLLFGGATHGGFLSDTLLQFTAIPLLLLALWGLWHTPLPK